MGEGAGIFEWAMGSILFFVAFTSLCNNPNNHRPNHLYQSYSQRAHQRYTKSLLSTAENYALADRPLRMQFYLMQAEALGDRSTRRETERIRHEYLDFK